MRKTLLVSAVLATAQISALSSGCCTTSCSGSGYDYGINPPFVFADYCSCNWTGHIDYLYWKADVSGAKWTTAVNNNLSATGADTLNIASAGNNKMVNFDWDSGFRVGLGYQFPCDKWAVSLDWTHYQTDTKKQLSENSLSTLSGGILPSVNYLTTPYSNLTDLALTPNFLGSVVLDLIGDSSLKGFFKLQHNQVDLAISRNFYVGPCMRMKPHMDISFLTLQETETICIDYSSVTFNGDEIAGDIRFTGKFKSEFKGVGIRGGLDTEWEICNGFGFCGEGSIGAYYGTFDTLNHSTLLGATLLIENFIEPQLSLNYSLDFPQKFQALRCSTDLALGLIWNTSFNCDRSIFTFKALWEHHCFMGFNMLPSVTLKHSDKIFIAGASELLTTPGYPSDVSYADGSIFFHGFTFSFAVSF